MEKSNKTEKDKISEALDNFANSSIKILNEALAGKDAIIRDLGQKVKDLEGQNRDLDYLITSGRDELKKELRQRIKNCKCKNQEGNK